MRPETLVPLLCAMCHISLAFPALTGHSEDDIGHLQVSILSPSPISAPLGDSVTIPCLVSLSIPSSTSTPIPPRVKWSVVSRGQEMEILVARGHRVKVNEAYRERASLVNYATSPEDLSLWLGDLRSADSGYYRCEVQQGLEDANDLVQLTVKGVVFHYRHASGRYAFSFPEAQNACDSIGAQIATPDQLLAAYHDGYEQCDAGWLADQSVRYPIQVPREGCYGDMNGQPGVRNYGTLEPTELFDVYCYVEQIDGEVFHDPIPQLLSLDEAQTYCERAGAELATTGQLYMAWSEGLDWCSPGWLADGSVRYPIVTPRERCGGALAEVKTLYLFSNQTGFLEPSSRHDVYCFKGHGNPHTDAPMDYMATEPEDMGQDVILLMQPAEELQLNQDPDQVEREAQRALDSLPAFQNTPIGEDLQDTPPTPISDMDSPFSPTTSSPNLLQPFDETLLPVEVDHDSQQPTLSLRIHNSSTPDQPEPETTPEFPEPSFEPHRHYQPMPETNLDEMEYPQASGSKHFQPMPETNLDVVDNNKSTTMGNHSYQIMTTMTSTTFNSTREVTEQHEKQDPTSESGHEEAIVGEHEQASTSAGYQERISHHPGQSTFAPFTEVTSVWSPQDGSGDLSQETDPIIHQEIQMISVHTTSVSPTSDLNTQNSTSPGTTDISRHLFLDHSEESGQDFYSTVVAHLSGTSTTNVERTGLLERLDSSGEQELQPLKQDDDHVGSGEEMATTGSPDLAVTSKRPVQLTTVEYQTMSTSKMADPTTEDEGSGYETGTNASHLEQEVFSVEPQTSSWDLHRTTSAPQESRDDLAYSSSGPMFISPTEHSASSTETDESVSDSNSSSTTEPTATPVSAFTQVFMQTWSPSTTTPQNVPEPTDPKLVTALIPPVDQSQVELEYGLTKPPTLRMLPNGRAAVGRAGKLSEACLEDPCVNGGTCVEEDGHTKCLCLPSYGGDFCQTDLEQCDAGWEKFQGFCYKHFNQRLSWEVAEQHCRMTGGHLVSIMSPEEQDFINTNYKEYQWTGLNDKTIEGDFHWSNGNPLLYENWYRGQPDSYFLSGEDCVVMVWHDSGRWSDVPCNYHLAYTCKKGTSLCGPPPKVPNASMFGKARQRYETDAIVRYYCAQGFQQRQNPLVKCLAGGRWEEPQIRCIPGAHSTTQLGGVPSPTSENLGLGEEESQTKESPQYWDIKF
ncbi:brevican core protein-like [Hypomesus transpacificus]|uniref:brevican core protein-like n=1 Tax=Hypomesus transpacificus TaxID=137520 RepID=UPI001F08366C|nr:brevican core protein-like [Hypomesus transpacificus]